MVFWLFDLSGFIKALVRNILSGCGLAQNRDVQGEVVLVTYIKPITSFLVKRAQLENTEVVWCSGHYLPLGIELPQLAEGPTMA